MFLLVKKYRKPRVMTQLVTRNCNQSSDSEDDPNDSEDHALSDCLEMDDSVEHSCEVLFVPDADVEHVTVHTKQVVNSSIFKL